MNVLLLTTRSESLIVPLASVFEDIQGSQYPGKARSRGQPRALINKTLRNASWPGERCGRTRLHVPFYSRSAALMLGGPDPLHRAYVMQRAASRFSLIGGHPVDQSLQRERAERLRDLHRGPALLILPNAWDAASARLFELAGFEAIGTTSSGIATSFGYPDGQRIPAETMLTAIERIAASITLPVSADMEAGYELSVEGVISSMRLALQAGAVGINFEDGTGNPSRPLASIAYQSEAIGGIRMMASQAGIPLVINARLDVFLREVGSPREQLAAAVERGNAYLEAGADCVFPIGLKDANTIAQLVREIHGPINILASEGVPSIDELEAMGVRRVSFGSSLIRSCLGQAWKEAQDIRRSRSYPHFAEALPRDLWGKLFR